MNFLAKITEIVAAKLKPEADYVLFTESDPSGIVVKGKEIKKYQDEDGYVYEVGKRLGAIQSF